MNNFQTYYVRDFDEKKIHSTYGTSFVLVQVIFSYNFPFFLRVVVVVSSMAKKRIYAHVHDALKKRKVFPFEFLYFFAIYVVVNPTERNMILSCVYFWPESNLIHTLVLNFKVKNCPSFVICTVETQTSHNMTSFYSKYRPEKRRRTIFCIEYRETKLYS